MSSQLTLNLDSTIESCDQEPTSTLLLSTIGKTACAALAEILRRPNLVCLDMGDTACDVSLLIKGEPDVFSSNVAEEPPAVSIHSIRIGGQSTIWGQANGLRVGPPATVNGRIEPSPDHSTAGPTVRDANLMLGQVESTWFANDKLNLDQVKATAAITALGQQIGLSPAATADAICGAVHTKIVHVIQAMAESRGLELSEFSLLIFGNTGPMHGVFVARELGITDVIVPHAPVMFSPWNILRTELKKAEIYGVSNFPPQLRPATFDGVKLNSITVYRDDLPVGIDFGSPAVVVEATTATVIPPGYRITVDDFGSLIIAGQES